MDKINILDHEFPIFYLDCKESFTNLSANEKKYAHALIKAGWNGALIDLVQCSPESPGIFILANQIFQAQNSREVVELIKSIGYDDADVTDFLNYFVMIYENLGNYRSFGDSKFVPRIDKKKFDAIIFATKAFRDDNMVKNVYENIKDSVYSLSDRNRQMGLGNDGISTYYSYNCTEEDAKFVQVYLDKSNISAYNTRVFKSIEGDAVHYEVRQASSESNKREKSNGDTRITLVNGDYRELMALMVTELQHAKRLSLNETEAEMIQCYIESFTTGSIESHKQGSRLWIRDRGPIVENYIGFIESYRDPIGVRGEFEAFIAVVNKQMSKKFEKLVESAPMILAELPWPPQYEKDTFLKPDFTSLDIINFPNSGMPVGINIPNYDDIRQSEGFKNVSLGNVLKARFQDPKVTFLRNCDKDVYVRRAEQSFEIQVGLHELIGHGSGKLFQLQNGVYNFDPVTTIDLLTNGKITSWYNDNETWDSVFTSVASPFEECRAECVGLYLCSKNLVLEIFGHTTLEESSEVIYVNWLSMVKSALISMEFYTPGQERWRQAHCQARFVILQALLEAGEGLLKIEVITGSDGKPDLEVHLDGTKIETVGRHAIGQLLKHLQYYKSTANYKGGNAFFSNYSKLDEHFLHLRDIATDRKSPRPAVVQCGLSEGDHGLQIIEYPSTAHGMIDSFRDRFSGAYGKSAIEALHSIWLRDQHHFHL